ncbi:MAG: hypothetical protein ACRELY_11410 [Polyangiaceae bacterium]
MSRRLSFALLFLVACSKPSTSTSTSTSTIDTRPSTSTIDARPSTSTSTPTSAPWTTCAEPRTLTQLGTLKDAAHFDGELLASTTGSFDPETLAPKVAPPSTTHPQPGITPSRYKQVVAGKGLIWHDDDHATVEDASTHKVILKAPICSAGGTMDFELSPTGRFLICISSRAGQMLWDLTAAHPNPDKPVSFGKDTTSDEGLSLAPNDAYGVVAPVLGWGTERPTRTSIEWLDFNAHTQKSLGAAPIAEPDAQGNLPKPSLRFGVAFCGDGVLFAVAESKELGVYRGSDAQKLASVPSMQGGDVSFSASGRYVSQTRNGFTTVYRLDR